MGEWLSSEDLIAGHKHSTREAEIRWGKEGPGFRDKMKVRVGR